MSAGLDAKSSLSARGGSARSDLSRLAEPQPATMQVAFAATHSVPDIRYEHGCGVLNDTMVRASGPQGDTASLTIPAEV